MKLVPHLTFILFVVTIFSCQSDGDINPMRHTNHEIKLLHASPIEIVQSAFKFDNQSMQFVSALEDTEIDGNTFIISNTSSDGQFAVSLDDELFPSGAFVIFRTSETDQYFGENLTIVVNESSVTLTGEVSNGVETKNLEITIQESQFEAGSSEYSIEDNIAKLSGTLGTITYNQILEINANYPDVNVIELGVIDGSVNDDVNVETGRLIREAGHATHLKANSMIFSGGVDLFCSGKIRTMETGAKIGVHSWCCYDGYTADKIAENSEGHHSQLAYFTEMLGETLGKEFYFFTIYSAPFDEIYVMSADEIEKYGLLTQ